MKRRPSRRSRRASTLLSKGATHEIDRVETKAAGTVSASNWHAVEPWTKFAPSIKTTSPLATDVGVTCAIEGSRNTRTGAYLRFARGVLYTHVIHTDPMEWRHAAHYTGVN